MMKFGDLVAYCAGFENPRPHISVIRHGAHNLMELTLLGCGAFTAISGVEMIPSWSYETQQCNESYLLPLCKKNTCATVGDQTFRSYMNSLIPRKDIASATKRKPVQRYALTHQLLSEARQARDQEQERQWPIDHPRGLLIRVRHGECAYYVQARAGDTVVKRKICLISEITIAEIKALAIEVIKTIKDGLDPDVAIAARLKGDDEAAVSVALDRAMRTKTDSGPSVRQSINIQTGKSPGMEFPNPDWRPLPFGKSRTAYAIVRRQNT